MSAVVLSSDDLAALIVGAVVLVAMILVLLIALFFLAAFFEQERADCQHCRDAQQIRGTGWYGRQYLDDIASETIATMGEAARRFQ